MFNPNFMNANSFVNSFGGVMNMMQQFNQIRGQLQGTPQQQAMQAQNIMQSALNNGQISQDQFTKIYQMAQQLSQMMPH